MIRDANLRFAQNQRPQGSQLGAGGGTFIADMENFYPLPNGVTIGFDNSSLDLQLAMDKGDGYPLKARFEIKEAFVADVGGGGNTTLFGFGIALCSHHSFITPDQILLCEGPQKALASWVVGDFFELTLPRLSTLQGLGRQFLFLGMRITTTRALTLNLFTAGLVDAHLTLDTQHTFVRAFPGGFVV